MIAIIMRMPTTLVTTLLMRAEDTPFVGTGVTLLVRRPLELRCVKEDGTLRLGGNEA